MNEKDLHKFRLYHVGWSDSSLSDLLGDEEEVVGQSAGYGVVHHSSGSRIVEHAVYSGEDSGVNPLLDDHEPKFGLVSG